MKVFICLFASLAIAHANLLAAPLIATSKLISTGSSTQTRHQDAAGNYAFAYKEQHATGGSSRSEQGNPWGAVGSYSLNVGDGRQRVVKYVADAHGFRAAVDTNEPGTAPKAPADVAISSPHALPEPVAIAPVATYAAPAYAAPAYAAPHAYAAAPIAAYAAPAYAAPAYAAPAHYAAPVAYGGSIDHASYAGLKAY